MITVATLSQLTDAYLLKSMLEAEKIPAFIPDENTCQVDWNYINALGGVRVQIPDEFVEAATPVLAEFKNGLRQSNVSSIHSTASTDNSYIRRKQSWTTALCLTVTLLAVMYAILFVYSEKRSIAFDDGCAALTKGDTDGALEDFNRAIQVNSQDPDAYLYRGITYERRIDYDRAIADFSRAINLNSGSEQAYANRGFCYDNKHEYDKALEDYNETLRLNPKNELTLCNRGNVYAQKGDNSDAISDYNTALQLDPRDTQTYFNRGDAYAAQGDNDQAIVDFSWAIQLDPKDVNAFNNRATAYDAEGKHAEAIKDYESAVQLEPKFEGGLNSLAWDLATCRDAGLRNGKEAIQYATRACQVSDWKDYFDLDTLATAYAETGDFDNAVKWEHQALGTSAQKSSSISDERQRLSLFEAHRPYHSEK
jgi:tetratricopeptide (TPR) repeat protein